MNQDQRIIVIGVGGAGCKIISLAHEDATPGVAWMAVDADSVSLQLTRAQQKVQIGRNMTHGLGSGGMAERGAQAAEETRAELRQALQGATALILTCGLAGGTGGGAAPVIGRIAQELGIWTVAVASKPFSFEGKRRARVAEAGLSDLAAHTAVQVVIPNESLLLLMDKKTTLLQAFQTSDRIMLKVIYSLIDLLLPPGRAVPGLEEIRVHIPYRDIAVVTAG